MEQRPILQRNFVQPKPQMNSQIRSTRVRAPDYHSQNVEAGSTRCRMNDVTSSKPIGREVAEEGRSKEKSLVSCKTYRHFGTLNCRTLRENWKREELAYNFVRSTLHRRSQDSA